MYLCCCVVPSRHRNVPAVDLSAAVYLGVGPVRLQRSWQHLARIRPLLDFVSRPTHHMSLSQLQSRAQPSEALFATRIEDQQGVLKAVVLMLNKQEVSGIPLTADWCRSFVLLWSALVGKLQAIDIGYLKRDLTTWYWASWPEVVEYLRQHLSTLPPDQVSVLHANVISHIQIKDVSDEVRSLLASDQRAFVDLVNGDSTPLSKGKVVMSGFWFKMAVAAWAAKHQRKTLSWPLAVTDTWAPLGGFSDKVLERAIRDRSPNVSGAIPRGIVSSGSAGASGSSQPSHSGPEVAGPPEPSGPVGRAPAAPSLPADDAALLTMPQLLLKTTEKTRDLPPESIKTAVGQLNTLLAPYPSMHRLGQQLLKLSDALSLSACLTSYSWPTGGDLPRIKCALVAWSRYIEEAGLITITDAVKSQHLLGILQAVRTAHHITSHHITSHHIASHDITSNDITPHHITSHDITSHHITSHDITSHHITSHHITSHHITSHHITSHPITSHHNDITSHHITSHDITSHHVTSHHITVHYTTSHHITSHHIASHHITSHHITSHHITSHRIASHQMTSHHITSHHITSHHITSHHITSHHITSHHIASHHMTSHQMISQHITSHHMT